MTDKPDYANLIEHENILLQIETAAAALMTVHSALEGLAAHVGFNLRGHKMSESDLAKRQKLLSSVANRLVRIATLSAEASGVEVDPKALTANVLKMLEKAAATGGESLADADQATVDVYEGAVADDVVVEPVHETVVNGKSVFDPHFDVDENEVEADTDLLAAFRTNREKKATDPYYEVEGGVLRANFYTPETLPTTPEEFYDYDDKAIKYFSAMAKKLHRSKIISNDTFVSVSMVLGDAPQEDIPMGPITSKDAKLTPRIVEQGHESEYFEVDAASTESIGEALVAAYSVSVARLRGAYIQAKMLELQEYASDHR